MRLQPGIYKVTRDCCTSGNCIVCMHRAPFGQTVRETQMENLSKESAEFVAKNWVRYNARVEEQ